MRAICGPRDASKPPSLSIAVFDDCVEAGEPEPESPAAMQEQDGAEAGGAGVADEGPAGGQAGSAHDDGATDASSELLLSGSSGSEEEDEEEDEDELDDLYTRQMDESFTSALHRLKETGRANYSPNSRAKADGEFKRLLRSNNKYVRKVRLRCAWWWAAFFFPGGEGAAAVPLAVGLTGSSCRSIERFENRSTSGRRRSGGGSAVTTRRWPPVPAARAKLANCRCWCS